MPTGNLPFWSRENHTEDQVQIVSEAAMTVWHDIYAMGIFGAVPILIALLYISLCSFLKEPARRNFNTIMLAGAGAAYLNGGFGLWEFVFTSGMTFVAYKGLQSYTWIGVGWLLHTGWDVLHHLYGNPIVPFSATSSLGCFICDPVIAIWCFMGGVSLFDVVATWLPTLRMTARQRE